MASYEFHRLQGSSYGGTVKFDSSPKYSLCKRYSWDEETFEMVKVQENDEEIEFRVFARPTGSTGKTTLVGSMKGLTSKGWWKSMSLSRWR